MRDPMEQQTGAYALKQCERCGVIFVIDTSLRNQTRRRYCDDCVRAADNEKDHAVRMFRAGLSLAAREAVRREEMIKSLRRRDLEYERHGGCRVTVAVRGGVRVETRGQPCYGGFVAHEEFAPGYRFKA